MCAAVHACVKVKEGARFLGPQVTGGCKMPREC